MNHIIKVNNIKEYRRTMTRLIDKRVRYTVQWNTQGEPTGIELEYADAYRLGYIKQDNSMYWAMAGLVVFLLVCVGLWVWSWFW